MLASKVVFSYILYLYYIVDMYVLITMGDAII